jgi:hypothetical protein
MTTKKDVQLAYNQLMLDLSNNAFYTPYIRLKTETKLRLYFDHIRHWLKRPLDEWCGARGDESIIADECLYNISMIYDYVAFLETVVLSGGGGGGTGDITGSGATTRIPIFNGTKSITSDSDFTYDTTNDILSVKNITHTGMYKENVITINVSTTLNGTHSHIVCLTGASPFTITLPTITSANVKITYNIKNISSAIVQVDTNGTQVFDGDVLTSITLGIGNQVKLVAVEISTGVYSWITFNN